MKSPARSLRHWLTTSKSKSRRRSVQTKRRRLFESLEQRRLLASDVFASAGGEQLSVFRDSTELVVVGTTSGELLREDASTIDSLRVVGSNNNDTLRLDYSSGFFATPISFEGGGQSGPDGDAIELLGGDIDGAPADSITHTFINSNDGSIAIAVGALTASIDYIGLEPIVDNLNAVDRVFNFTGGSEAITLSDGAAAGDDINFIDSTLGESVLFVSPTNSLTVNSGSGTDAIVVTTLDTAYAASLTIDGGDDGNDTLTVTDVDLISTPGRGLSLSELETISITGGTISGNTATIGGGVLINNSTLATTTANLDGVTIANNTATGGTAPLDGGGGIYNNGAVLNINATSLISGNIATTGQGSGGGIFSTGTLTITGATLTGNDANRAGGGIEIAEGSGPTTLTDVTLTLNDALAGPGNGGGLHVTGAGNVAIVRGTVTGNTAASEGGGLWNGSGTMSINGTLIENNTASGNAADNGGGGVFNNAGVLDIDDAIIQGNQADGILGSGGGVFSLANTVVIDNSTIQNNSANRAGGGIEVVAGTVTLTDLQLLTNDVDGLGTTATAPNPGNGGGLHVTATATVTLAGGLVQGNVAREEGGGLWNSDTGTLIIDNVMIDANTARAADGGIDQGGGGVFNNGGDLFIRNNTTITDNLANENLGNGGGVMTVGGTVTIENTTLTGNQAARAGGGIENNGGTVTLTNVTVGGANVADGNIAGINGGGLHAAGAASITVVDGGLFQNNIAQQEGGGLWNGDGTLTIRGTTITQNTANSASNANNDQGGGGVFNIGGTLDIDNAMITENLATANDGNGGGVMTVGGVVTIDDSSIQSNQAARAGGGIENNNGVVTVTNETVGGPVAATGNTAGINGGGLHASGDDSETTVNGGLFQNNIAGEEGGGLWNGSGVLNINGTQILNNTANSGSNGANDQGGGGVFNIGGMLNIDSATITDNIATMNNGNGGGVMTVGGTVTIDETVIQSNEAARAGGGVENNNGNVTLTSVSVGGPDVADGNTAGINGGGLHAAGAASVTVVDGGLFQNNIAEQEGGGLWNGDGTLTIRNNTTITQNTANSAANGGNDQGGGGVFNIGGTLDIDDATITENLATANLGNGGGVMTVSGLVTIDNTFIGSNSSGRDGGGLHASAGSDVTVTGGTVQLNVAPEEGGGLWNGSGRLAINGTTVTENTANSGDNAGNDQGGGGVFNDGGVLDIDNAIISSNLATANNGNGGGVMTVGGMVTIDNTAIENNDAARAGGGVENNAGNVTLTNVTLGGPTPEDGNTAGINGGGLHAAGAVSVTVVDGGIVQNNVAGQEGGGLWNGDGTMTVQNGTLVDSNVADGTEFRQGGGGAFNDEGTLNLNGVTLTNNLTNITAGSLASGGGAFNNIGELNVVGSIIAGNNQCGLTFFRPQGSIIDNTFPTAANGLAINVGGNLCPLIGTDGDDIIFVLNNEIRINDDVLMYDDDTLGPITIESGLGNDTFNIQSTDVDNTINADGGDGSDQFIISSNAPSLAGNLDGILGEINIVGGANLPPVTTTLSVQADRSPTESETVSATVVDNGDRLQISDATSNTVNSYTLSSTQFARTAANPTNVVNYTELESLEITTGTSDDQFAIASTTDNNQLTLNTSTGSDVVTVTTTGSSSITQIDTVDGDDTVTVNNTGDSSILSVQTGSGTDTLAINDRGDGSGIAADTQDGADVISVGDPTAADARPGPGQSVVLIEGGDGNDAFAVDEVFLNTVIELQGQADNDEFVLTTQSADAGGYLSRINSPRGGGLDDASAATRQLLIDGGGNTATREYVEGISFDEATGFVAEPETPGDPLATVLSVGDTVVVDASGVNSSLDLRYTIVSNGEGVLATTRPADTQADRQEIGNEVIDSLNVETIQIRTGPQNDILSITSEIAYGIANSGQAIQWDGGGVDIDGDGEDDNNAQDRLEIAGTDFDDRITIGDLTDNAPFEPIEIDAVELIRIDGRGGDDEVSNRTDAISAIDGGTGSDTLLGGSRGDLLTGGRDEVRIDDEGMPVVNRLFGRDGDDVIFSDQEFGSDETFEGNGDFLNGGGQDSLNPGDTCIQLGADIVRNCEVLGDGGAIKDVLTWLRSRLIAGDSVEFNTGAPQLELFENFVQGEIPNVEVTEPSSLDGLGGGGVIAEDTPAAEGEMVLDVNSDDRVTAVDALIIINQLNRNVEFGSEDSLNAVGEPLRNPADVNADGRVTPIDALMVINALNRYGSTPMVANAEPLTVNDSSFDDASTDLAGLTLFEEVSSVTKAVSSTQVDDWKDGVDAVFGADDSQDHDEDDASSMGSLREAGVSDLRS